MSTITQDPVVPTRKSGLGARHGVISEVSALLHVRPGRVEELRAACKRFETKLKGAPPALLQHFGLHYMRHVLFDGGERMLWITAFDTDWDPYIDDSVNTLGVKTWIDWLQHCEECPVDVTAYTSNDVKRLIQAVQTQASCFFQTISDATLAEQFKGRRLVKALDTVVDDPQALALLQQPALKPLLDEAVD
jgi:hypothetical protein